jgi:hypothetical protein
LGEQIKNDGISGQVALNQEKRNAHKVWGGKLKQTHHSKDLGRWEENIKIHVKNRTGWHRP